MRSLLFAMNSIRQRRAKCAGLFAVFLEQIANQTDDGLTKQPSRGDISSVEEI